MLLICKRFGYTPAMTGKRTYDDPCGIARGLDLVGERWALLVVRELLLGPKRFSGLHRGLPALSQNVLTHRLRELEEAGVVRRRRLGPPAVSWAYELTAWGRELEPVLFHLGRWGSRAPMTTDGELSTDALIIAMRTAFDGEAAGEFRAQVELWLGDDRFHAGVADGRVDLSRVALGRTGPDTGGNGDGPNAVPGTAVLRMTGPATLRALVFGGRDLDDALRAGDLDLLGDRRVAERFLALFPRPTPAMA
ncbi:transcriptional regulator [Planotetraspora silvatica]|uniref:Transcriptional regulator n=2 Tax=Planotetraspora silvatica TaxID=234614 RepID=A0A8J3XM26_9ACTN|nr:transcriptional regulator [Planotetraspora silvatica]